MKTLCLPLLLLLVACGGPSDQPSTPPPGESPSAFELSAVTPDGPRQFVGTASYETEDNAHRFGGVGEGDRGSVTFTLTVPGALEQGSYNVASGEAAVELSVREEGNDYDSVEASGIVTIRLGERIEGSFNVILKNAEALDASAQGRFEVD